MVGLLIGFYPNVLIGDRYTESLQLFRATPDPVWQASALEGLATISILDAWSAGHGLVCSSRFQYSFL